MTDGMTEATVRDGEEPRRGRGIPDGTPDGGTGLPDPRAEDTPVPPPDVAPPPDHQPSPDPTPPPAPVPPPDLERRRRRAEFLRDLKEARELRERVQPRRARAARMRRQQLRMRSFRW
ncbi:hypothetical protein [Streptomyces sp. NPDC047046]|uniref:hypothetical protein n=1 Tax=Streptomyces sp. NPDC047046 TaxID=3155378 RepID=UPI0034093A26